MTAVPMKKLNNGVEMPMLGYGVFQTPPAETAQHVRTAIEVGYRHIDTAQAYGNEEGVGQAVKQAIAEGLTTREDMFITTKLWVSNYGPDRAEAAIDASLAVLDLEYIDLMLLHQPFGDVAAGYRALTRAYQAGKIRAIGVSNFYPRDIVTFAELAEVMPAVNQIETHPFLQRTEEHALMERFGIAHESWGPFAEGRNGIFTNPVLTVIGEKYGKKAGQVALRALIQEDVIVIPKSVRAERMAENFDVLDFELDAEDMAAFRSLEDGSFDPIFDHNDIERAGGLLSYITSQIGGPQF